MMMKKKEQGDVVMLVIVIRALVIRIVIKIEGLPVMMTKRKKRKRNREVGRNRGDVDAMTRMTMMMKGLVGERRIVRYRDLLFVVVVRMRMMINCDLNDEGRGTFWWRLVCKRVACRVLIYLLF